MRTTLTAILLFMAMTGKAQEGYIINKDKTSKVVSMVYEDGTYGIWNYKKVPETGYYMDTCKTKTGKEQYLIQVYMFYNAVPIIKFAWYQQSDIVYSAFVDIKHLEHLSREHRLRHLVAADTGDFEIENVER